MRVNAGLTGLTFQFSAVSALAPAIRLPFSNSRLFLNEVMWVDMPGMVRM